ncbi:TIGR03986 family CRISPR-associated RAMP protein [Murimonas intestini]|uniref:TIGR03986 family type III CRISPR-associated RAMP protein n=1 Tax=Murimonas intestini TaxID=1337051 RepID=UPI0011DD9295|nr:TIGR03986 family CRISPR-associated RAMP protein [Murimonas intestini]
MDKTYTYIDTDTTARFVNPYNFIPLGEECRRDIPKTNDQDAFTGYFECRVKLLTPLFIPNTSSSVRLLTQKEWEKGKQENKKYSGYDFFSYDDLSEEQPYISDPPAPPCNPVIPGSEIRGAVRSVFEAAFNGCMSSVDENRDISRRCGEVKNPGILYWDCKERGWRLKSCNKVKLLVEQKEEQSRGKAKGKLVTRKEYDTWQEGQKIWVYIDNKGVVYDYGLINGRRKTKGKENYVYREGYLHKGEYIDGKKYESVFWESGGQKLIRVRNEDIELLKKILKEYRDSTKNCKVQDEKWYEEFEVPKDGTRILVYYSKDSVGRIYLCPACIGRETFLKTVGSLLKSNGEYQPCNSEKLCSACQIFGMMEKAEKPGTYAYGSKVRFTDAMLIKPVKNSSFLFEDPIVLPELAEPRPSAVEFYTESPYKEYEETGGKDKQGYWTYDYKYQYKREERKEKFNVSRMALGRAQPKLRGRKYYWHKDVNMDAFTDNKVNAMQQRIRPMKPDTERDSQPLFQFCVYFEQLNKKQLEQLKWALDFGSPECAHKIGRGKPLGFGSAQIIVDKLNIREINEDNGCWKIKTIGKDNKLDFENFFKSSGQFSEEIPKALKIMANWEKRPENVNYPIGEDKTVKSQGENNAAASHQWFRLNKGKDNFKPNFSKTLPAAEDDANNRLSRKKALYRLIEKEK